MSENFNQSPASFAYETNDFDAIIARRRPSFGEYMGASIREGFWGTTTGVMGAYQGAMDARQNDPTPLARHEWEASSYWRPGVEWDERMTVGRAAAIAETNNDMRYRQHIMNARDPGPMEWLAGMGAQIVGGIPAVENFLPIARPIARGLRALEAGTGAARLGAVAGRLERPGVVGGLTRGATEGVGGNIMAAPLVYSIQESFGDNITWGRVAADLAIGAIIGGGFGAALSRRGLIQPDPIASGRILDDAAWDVAAGRTPDPPMGLVRAVTEDAIVRSAPPEARAFLRATDDGAGTVSYRTDLPTRQDGTPLTREEFAAELDRRTGTSAESREATARAADAARGEENKADTLVRWLIRNGGLRDDNGELRAVVGSHTARPGLINQRGMAPDMAVQRAREAGFFNDRMVGDDTPDTLTTRDLWDAIDNELRETGVRRPGGAGVEARNLGPSGDRLRHDWEADVDESFRWYQEALKVQQRLDRMAPAVRDEVTERAAIMQYDAGLSREKALVEAARERAMEPGRPAPDEAGKAPDDPILAQAERQIEAMRAEGRFTEADAALLRAGREQADELDGMARGMNEAAACTIRTMA